MGSGIAHTEEGDEVELAPGTCLTLVKDALLHLEQSGDQALEFYFVELGVPEAGL
jgi:hypothetical protein